MLFIKFNFYSVLPFEILEYEVREKPSLSTWMQGGLDYIMLQYLNIDGIRTIGSVLGQSIALDYYGRQVCSSSCQDFLIPYTGDIPLKVYLTAPFCFYSRLMEWLQNLLT